MSRFSRVKIKGVTAKGAMSLLGRIGGQVRSEKKAAAARLNGRLGGRPRGEGREGRQLMFGKSQKRV